MTKTLPVTRENAQAFSDAVEAARALKKPGYKGLLVDPVSPDEVVQTAREISMSRDGKTGFLIGKDHEVKALYNIGKPGAGGEALEIAKRHGGRRVTCYGEDLSKGFYRKHGFPAVAQYPFTGQSKPPTLWPEEYGAPDLFIHTLAEQGEIDGRPITHVADRPAAVAVEEAVAASIAPRPQTGFASNEKETISFKAIGLPMPQPGLISVEES